MFVSHLYVFFGEMSNLVLAHFLIESFIFLELSCMSCLYIFEISCLSVASFAMQKLLTFFRSHLFIPVIIFMILDGGSTKILLRFMSKSVLGVFF